VETENERKKVFFFFLHSLFACSPLNYVLFLFSKLFAQKRERERKREKERERVREKE